MQESITNTDQTPNSDETYFSLSSAISALRSRIKRNAGSAHATLADRSTVEAALGALEDALEAYAGNGRLFPPQAVPRDEHILDRIEREANAHRTADEVGLLAKLVQDVKNQHTRAVLAAYATMPRTPISSFTLADVLPIDVSTRRAAAIEHLAFFTAEMERTFEQKRAEVRALLAEFEAYGDNLHRSSELSAAYHAWSGIIDILETESISGRTKRELIRRSDEVFETAELLSGEMVKIRRDGEEELIDVGDIAPAPRTAA